MVRTANISTQKKIFSFLKDGFDLIITNIAFDGGKNIEDS